MQALLRICMHIPVVNVTSATQQDACGTNLHLVLRTQEMLCIIPLEEAPAVLKSAGSTRVVSGSLFAIKKHMRNRIDVSGALTRSSVKEILRVCKINNVVPSCKLHKSFDAVCGTGRDRTTSTSYRTICLRMITVMIQTNRSDPWRSINWPA